MVAHQKNINRVLPRIIDVGPALTSLITVFSITFYDCMISSSIRWDFMSWMGDWQKLFVGEQPLCACVCLFGCMWASGNLRV